MPRRKFKGVRKMNVYEAWSQNADGTYAVATFRRYKDGTIEILRMDHWHTKPWVEINLPQEFIAAPQPRGDR